MKPNLFLKIIWSQQISSPLESTPKRRGTPLVFADT